MPVEIGSTGEWDRALSSNAVVVADCEWTPCCFEPSYATINVMSALS